MKLRIASLIFIMLATPCCDAVGSKKIRIPSTEILREKANTLNRKGTSLDEKLLEQMNFFNLFPEGEMEMDAIEKGITEATNNGLNSLSNEAWHKLGYKYYAFRSLLVSEWNKQLPEWKAALRKILLDENSEKQI